MPTTSICVMEVFRGVYVACNSSTTPFRKRLVQLTRERGPLQLPGATKLLGRDRWLKQAMSEQRLRRPTFLELLGDLVTTGRGQRTTSAKTNIAINGTVNLMAPS